MSSSTIARNLQVHLAEPNAHVNVKPPRGGFGGKTMMQIPKDTWLGGVLEGHLTDTRSTYQQTLSLLKPWTWGRSGNGGAEDVVQYQWRDGSMPK